MEVFCGDDLDDSHIVGTTSSADAFSFSVVFTTSSDDNSNTDDGFSLLLIGMRPLEFIYFKSNEFRIIKNQLKKKTNLFNDKIFCFQFFLQKIIH